MEVEKCGIQTQKYIILVNDDVFTLVTLKQMFSSIFLRYKIPLNNIFTFQDPKMTMEFLQEFFNPNPKKMQEV